MRLGHPTDDELRQNFEQMLTSVRDGGGLWTETGLDIQTEESLWAIAHAYPEVTDELVTAARKTFDGQLDGSNARARREQLERQLEQLRRRPDQQG